MLMPRERASEADASVEDLQSQRLGHREEKV